MLRGAGLTCPCCGAGHLYWKYLKILEACDHCGQELHHHRADDAPPYFTILLVGHIVFPLIFIAERFWQPPLWIHFSIWLPILTLLCLALLPVIKGSIVGLQWALRMHGFDQTGATETS